MQATFLDFDGVIVDSIEECYIVSCDAYYGFSKRSADEQRLKRFFYRYRSLVKPPYQYLVLHRIIENADTEKTDDIELQFTEMDQKMTNDEKVIFEQLFFKARKNLQKNHTAWLKLNPLTAFGRSLQGRTLSDSYIVTTKDTSSVEVILRFYDIGVGGIFGHEDYVRMGTKGKIISTFLDQTDKYHSGIFVDDAVDHLQNVQDPRVQCYFAEWGYGTNRGYPNFSKELW